MKRIEKEKEEKVKFVKRFNIFFGWETNELVEEDMALIGNSMLIS